MKMDLSELEILYSPSQWAKYTTAENRIKEHIHFITEGTERSRRNIPCELNISYGEGNKQKYDLYGKDLPDDSPIFVFVHGGYWQELSKDESGFMAENFYKNGIKTIVIGYTLCPETSLRQILKEIEKCFEKIIEYSKKMNTKGIYISGYSAGAHLIASLFTNFYPRLTEDEKSLIKLGILCSGIYNLEPLIETYINKPLNLDSNEAKELSPLNQTIHKFNFDIYIVVGENESPEFIKQSNIYFKKIHKVTKAHYQVIQNTDHFSIVENYIDKNYILFRIIQNLTSQQNS